MRTDIRNGLQRIKVLFDEVLATDAAGATMPLEEGLGTAVCRILELMGGKVLFIGNGASASIASHMATDLWKNGLVRAMAFNDGALLTCISNDFGYECVFEKPIEMFGDRGDILIAVSSSGQSRNVLNGVAAARRRHMMAFTLSGFRRDNPLRQMGDVNFYVPSSSYGPVEVLHHALCHAMIDAVCRHTSNVSNVSGPEGGSVPQTDVPRKGSV